MKTLWLMVVICVTIVSVAAILSWQLGWFNPRLRIENFRYIAVGMSQSEVEELLGGPPGHYGRNWGISTGTLEGFEHPNASVELVWTDDSNCLEVFFDAKGKVVMTSRRAGYSRAPR